MALIYLYFLLAILVGIIGTARGRAWWRWFLISLFITPVIAGLLVLVLPRQPSGHKFTDNFGISSAHHIEAASADCTLRIIRLSSFSERRHPYEIFVNGAFIGAVKRNRVIEFRVPAGTLVVEIRTGRVGSRPLMIEASPERKVEIEVWNRGGPLRAIWAATLGADEFLAVRQRPTASAAAASA
jgi:hypothetical protein